MKYYFAIKFGFLFLIFILATSLLAKQESILLSEDGLQEQKQGG